MVQKILLGTLLGMLLATIDPAFSQSPVLILSDIPDVSATEAYKSYLKHREEELAEVQYLISSIRKTPHKFVRNGKQYSGDTAAKFLSYKLKKNIRKIKSAEDFIDIVASRSEDSGKDYLIVFRDGTTRPTHEVLLDEITRLRAYEEEHFGYMSPNEIIYEFAVRMRQALCILLAIFIAHEWFSSVVSARIAKSKPVMSNEENPRP